MAPPIRLNLLNPAGNSYVQYQYYATQNNLNTAALNQGQFRGFHAGRFNGMIAQVVNSKPGCSSCGK
jgi:hypothetical protein